MKAQSLKPILLTWQDVGELVHQSSYNGVMKFARKNKLKTIKSGKRTVFHAERVYETLNNLGN